MGISQYKYLKWFAYVLYGCLLTGVLLVVRFPEEELKKILVDTLEEKLPTTQCSLGRLSYQFPLTIKAHDLQFKTTTGSRLIFKVDDILIRPALGDPARLFVLSAIAYGREHGCRLRMDWQNDRIFINDFEINQLDLAELDFLHDALGRKLSGFMDVWGMYSGSTKMSDDGEAKGKIVITDGEFDLLAPVLLQKSINIKKAETDFIFKEKVLELSNGHFNGSRFKGDFAGTVGMPSLRLGAKLDMNGKCIPKAALLKNNPRVTGTVNRLKSQYKSSALPFVIKGEVEKPAFRFGS